MDPRPMDNALVRNRVFSFCSVETLKSCRLVCKDWKDDSLNAWRDKAVLRISVQAKGNECSISLEEYLQLLNSEGDSDEDDDDFKKKNRGFKNFRIQSDFPEYLKESAKPISGIARHVILDGYDYDDRNNEFIDFLSKFQSLESLELNCRHKVGYVEREEERLFQSPRLKRLKILLNYAHSIYSGMWEGILKCFPKLEALSIEFSPLEKPFGWAAHLEAILEFFARNKNIQNESVFPLKELEIVDCAKVMECRLNKEHILPKIEACRFPLERLTVDMAWDEIGVSMHPIVELLNSYKGTLQYFKTSFPVTINHFTPTLIHELAINSEIMHRRICMPEMKEIILMNGLPWGLQLIAHVELPNLEKLIVGPSKKVNAKQVKLSFPIGRVYEKLKHFEFLDNHRTPGPKMIETFMKMMPNLTHLTIPLDKITFRMVCEKLKGLKILNILAARRPFLELDDESLTGVSKENEEGCGPRSPNITDLTCLTGLSISCEFQLQLNDKFTDHSVLHGFLQLPQLYSLSIFFKQLSNDTKAKLLHHIKENLHIQEKTVPESDPEYCAVEIDTDYRTPSPRPDVVPIVFPPSYRRHVGFPMNQWLLDYEF